jgi:large subunit ribosomal protein L21
MFAIVRTGGKQYRVSPGDKIVVEKLPGEAGESITLSDVLLAGDGSDLKGTDGLTVAAEIIAQAKGEKVIVFKKRRRHNYRRKKGHRQQHTILKIVSVGGQGVQAPAASAAPAPADTSNSTSNAAPATERTEDSSEA